MAFSWTPKQQAAIDARERTLLISAAAGSGKTAVLTERIIERLRDPVAPVSLDRMLIVTFTKAAAGELKARIGTKLTEALESDPTNRKLAAELSALSRARISTIDSFCGEMVKANFDRLGLPCGMRTADATEAALMKTKVMNAMFDELYGDSEEFEDFERFTDGFITDRDDSLPELFLKLYNSLSSYAEGIDILERFAAMLHDDRDKPFFESAHGAYLAAYLRAFADTYEQHARRAAEYYENCGKTAQKYAPGFRTIENCIRTLRTALDAGDFDAVRIALFDYPEDNLNGARLGSEEDEVFYKQLHKHFKADIANIKTQFLCFRADELPALYDGSAQLCTQMHRFLTLFERSYTKEKRKRRVLDFSDIERYALALLCRDGEPTDFAREYSAGLDEIYIDEYQDINGLQDTIFRMISTETPRFMVGDIKQSIYGFRGAEPDIFADYRTRFAHYDPDTHQDAATIFLSENFRCARPVVEFCNLIFPTLMNNAFGGVPYLPEDNLTYAKAEDDPVTAPVEVAIINHSTDNCAPISEPEYVAERIAQLFREGYTADDIVILLRSPKTAAKKYEQALSALDIPSYNAEPTQFFETPEVLLALDLLNIIDNPRRDIYLAGALRSPIFGFTLDELTAIRRCRRDGYLYDALCDYAVAHPSPKTDAFFDFLEQMRAYAASAPIDRLLRHLYASTALLSITGGENGERSANLMMLYEYARNFESGSFKGLYNFILYVGEIIASGTRTEEAKTGGEGAPAVRIMSVHASKGLEFKVCFLCNTGSPDRQKTDNGDLLLDGALGLNLYTPDPTGLARINGLLRRIVNAKARATDVAEEMRVLYVALTRAKERLIVTGEVANATTLEERTTYYAKAMSPVTALSCINPITMILTALKKHTTQPCWALHLIGSDYQSTEHQQAMETQAAPLPETPEYDECMRTLTERFSFRYAHTATSELPSKLSVSRLYPAVLDEEEEQQESAAASMLERPRFMEDDARATAAERGTATHVFMQFCDFAAVERAGVDAEIDRLIAKKFIPAAYRDRIRRDTLARFFQSPLFARMRGAKKLWRETRFNIALPAADFTQVEQTRAALSDQTVLVQGVIDCFFEESDGSITVVDYKTDAFTREQRADPDACVRILRERHASQLGYYRLALERLLDRPVSRTLIYSFDLGCEIEL